MNTSFCSTHSAFKSYIFVTGRNDSDQKASDDINNFAVHHPHVSRQKSENPAYFLLSISIAILFSLKQHRQSNTRIFSLFLISYVCITCLSIRSQCDLENPLNDLKVYGKKYFFPSQSLKTCDNIASNNLEMIFILFTIYHSKCKNKAKFFTLILLLSGDINLNSRSPHNSQIDGLNWNVFDKKGLHFLHTNVNSLLPKIDEIRLIAKKSKATVIGITETKLDGTIIDSEIYIKVYSIVRCDRQKRLRCCRLYKK